MTIEADPTRTRPVVLSQHADLPEHRQPTIHCYVPRMRTSRRLSAALEQLQGLGKDSSLSHAERVMSEIVELVRSMVAGWDGLTDERGNAVESDPEKLEDALTEGDITELAGEIYQLGMITAQEKKDSDSPSTSNGTAAPSGESTSGAPSAAGPDAASASTA